jgi:thymidylate kinase
MALVGGGSVLALIGGDGAGKSTCGRELGRWLGEDFPTLCAHLGRPPRSLTTLVIGGALKLERRLYQLGRRPVPVGSQIELLRHICTARDRYRLYEKVRRFAAAGGLAVCERYPVPQNRFLVGPCIPSLIGPAPSRRALLLRDIELSYYKRILPPDALFVLRLDPELAVIRKPDEPADYVRTRGRVIWETDWSTTGAHVVDASRPLSQVLQDLKARVWSVL